jgi:hypothetical protein
MSGSHQNKGGPAFPCEDASRFYHGMSLRDWFAGQALAGVLQVCVSDTLADGETYLQHVGKNAYRIADAMLAERAKP